MEFSNLLKPEAIRIFSSVSSKKRLLHDLAGIAETCYHTDYSNTVEALIEREALGPTGVGGCLLYTSPSPRDATLSRMPSSA